MRMQLTQRFAILSVVMARTTVGEGAIEAEIDLRNARDCGETLLVVRAIDAESADVVERPGFETEEILASMSSRFSVSSVTSTIVAS